MESFHGHSLENVAMALVPNINLTQLEGIEMKAQPAEYESCNWERL